MEHGMVASRKTRPSCTAALATSFVALLLAVSSTGSSIARAEPQGDAESDLLARYAPVLASPRQRVECGPGEPFHPIAVDAVLGRADVALRDGRGRLLKKGPNVRDLATAGADAHLDFPGKALKPGCSYEKWFDSLEAEPTMYGRVVTDPDHPDRTALQYWFFWIYNDWNDRHEGDWEMMQIIFDQSDATADAEPDRVIVAQHEGGEVQDWDSMALWGDRPLVFPADGSHATYYSPNRWLGTDARSGFGCDDTRVPSNVITPTLVVLPRDVPSADDDSFAWLAWQGRWGEKQPGFNNGPTGPATKEQWLHPVTWFEEEGRPASFSLPPLGTPITNVFCSLASRASLAMFEAIDRPVIVMVVALLFASLLVWAIRRTRWRPNNPHPVDAPRHTGALWIASTRFLFGRWRSFLPFVAILFVSGSGVRVLQHLTWNLSTSSDLSAILNERGALASILVNTVWGVITLPVTATVLGCVTSIFNRERAGLAPMPTATTVRSAMRREVFAPSLLFTVLMLMLLVPVYQLIAAFLAARWMVAPVFAPSPHPFRDSALVTRGHRRRAIRIGFITLSVAALLGPFIGTLLLTTTTVPIGALNTVSAVMSAVLLPWAMITMGYLHADLVTRARVNQSPP